MVDTILINGKIHTLDGQYPRVSALAIQHGRIVALGDDDTIRALAGPNTRQHDLGGCMVVPGLKDAHLHFEWLSRALQAVDLFEVPSQAEAVERVAQRVANTPPGEWITGRGWTQDLWEGGRFPTAADLDPISPQHPVYLQAKSGHAGWVNSAALQAAGIHADTPDPEGGKIERDAEGQATGLLLETAMHRVAACIPSPSPEQLADWMAEAQKLMLASGLTGFHDYDDPSCLRGLQILRERGQLALRVVKNINQGYLDAALTSGLRWGFGDDWLRIGGLKLFADGALGPRTAWMIEAYEGEPNNFGMPVVDADTMRELVARASLKGLPSTIHAIGDQAVRAVLDVYAAVREVEAEAGIPPETRRHRIEHVQIIHPDDVTRLAQLGVIASMQPIHATADHRMADHYWGERACWAYNPRLQLDAGAVVAFGSDAPVEPFAPLQGLLAAVARRRADGSPGPQGWYPEARLSLEEALRGFTVGPAYAAGLEDRLGPLSLGYLADLVVLGADLEARDPLEWPEIDVVATMVGGAWRHGGL